jgi:hypothetical protein
VHDVDQMLRASSALAIPIARRIRNVHANVILERLGHQAASGAAPRHGQLHHFGAIGASLQCALDRLDLPAHTALAHSSLRPFR